MLRAAVRDGTSSHAALETNVPSEQWGTTLSAYADTLVAIGFSRACRGCASPQERADFKGSVHDPDRLRISLQATLSSIRVVWKVQSYR